MKKCLLVALIIIACNPSPEENHAIPVNKEDYDYSAVGYLFEPLSPPEPGDWLYSHEEKYISFDEYVNSNPRRPDVLRNVIYIQPIGSINLDDFKYIETTKLFFENFFGLKVKIKPLLSASVIPKKARRIFNGHEQWLTKYILHELLAPALPFDAIAIIALTDHDLYPGDDWNFVFGQASVKKGVGVWSYFHYGNPDNFDNQPAFLERILKTAGHETCHMFSIRHCVSYKCLMNGSNSLYESDHKPLYLCPDCLAKLCYNLQIDPMVHIKKMQKFWSDHKTFTTANFYKTLSDNWN